MFILKHLQKHQQYRYEMNMQIENYFFVIIVFELERQKDCMSEEECSFNQNNIHKKSEKEHQALIFGHLHLTSFSVYF